MTTPLSQRLFGLRSTEDIKESVQFIVERLRAASSEKARAVIVAQLDDTVADAHALFRSHDLHHLPVVSSNKVVGIVSSTDLLAFFSETPLMDPAEAPLRDIMTADPHVIRKEASIRDLIKTLAHAHFRCVPVVNANGEIWDIVTTRDLVRFLEMTYC